MRLKKYKYDAFFVLFLVFFSAPVITLAQKVKKVSSQTGEGLHTVTFKMDKGKIHVNLPDDMTRRDVISGTVIVEPAGKNEKERAKNRDKLNGCVVKVDEQKTSADKKWDKWTISADVSVLPIILINSLGKEIGKAEVPVQIEPTLTLEGFRLPRWGQAGHSIRIQGDFDGDFSSTSVWLGDSEVPLLAESQRGLIFESPYDMIGPMSIRLIEGSFESEGEYRNIGVELTSPRLKLNRGEITELTVTITGLEGLNEEIPVEIENETPGIIDMDVEGTVYIYPDEVDEEGIFTYSCTLRGIEPGGFTISASVVFPEEFLVLMSPEDGEELETPTPTFTWDFEHGLEAVFTINIWPLDEELEEKVEEKYGLTEEDFEDIEPYFVEEGIRERWFVYPEDAENPLLPRSSYGVQVEAWSDGLLIAKSDLHMFRMSYERKTIPPRLLWPTNGATVINESPVFTWLTLVHLTPYQVITYSLKIVELLEGQTRDDAMQSNPVWFEQDEITTTSFQYTVDSKAFEQGKTYCWQVQAFDEAGYPIGDNEGLSDVGGFVVSFPPRIAMVPLKIIINEIKSLKLQRKQQKTQLQSLDSQIQRMRERLKKAYDTKDLENIKQDLQKLTQRSDVCEAKLTKLETKLRDKQIKLCDLKKRAKRVQRLKKQIDKELKKIDNSILANVEKGLKTFDFPYKNTYGVSSETTKWILKNFGIKGVRLFKVMNMISGIKDIAKLLLDLNEVINEPKREKYQLALAWKAYLDGYFNLPVIYNMYCRLGGFTKLMKNGKSIPFLKMNTKERIELGRRLVFGPHSIYSEHWRNIIALRLSAPVDLIISICNIAGQYNPYTRLVKKIITWVEFVSDVMGVSSPKEDLEAIIKELIRIKVEFPPTPKVEPPPIIESPKLLPPTKEPPKKPAKPSEPEVPLKQPGGKLSVSVIADKKVYKVGGGAQVTVTVKANGFPVDNADVKVELTLPSKYLAGSIPTWNYTDKRGIYTYDETSLLPGIYKISIKVCKEGYQPVTVSTSFKVEE